MKEKEKRLTPTKKLRLTQTHTHVPQSRTVCKQHRINRPFALLLASIHPSIPCEDKRRRENERCTVQLDTHLLCQSPEESIKYNGLCSKKTKDGMVVPGTSGADAWKRVRAERLDSSTDPMQLHRQLNLHNHHHTCLYSRIPLCEQAQIPGFN